MGQESSYNSLLNDDNFINWIKGSPTEKEWKAFKKNHTMSDHDIELAREIIEQVSKPISIPNTISMQEDIWNNIESKTLASKKSKALYVGIASLFLITILSLSYLYNKSANVENDIASVTNDQWIEYINTTNSNWPINLSDGSQVILEPQAQLKYPSLFSEKTRKVQLKGDAFFDITHDTLKPFYVYANEAVVRVIGTSFYVKAEEDDKDIQVIVKTGKVAVYKGKEIKEFQAKKIKKLEPLYVTPNQIATLEKSTLKLDKRLISRPTITQPLKKIKKIHFENSSIDEIFQALEDAYGIEIILGENITSDCRLTTTLTDQPLFEKLKIICDPLGLIYIEKNVKIHIIGSCYN